MDKNDMVKKIYDSIIDGLELTTKCLKELGINSKNINDLLYDGIIVRVSRGKYHIADVNDLYLYGMERIKFKDYERSEKCFDFCYQIDSKHSGARFQMFLKCIKKNDYNNILKYYDELIENDNKYYLSDTNIYLYLLNMIIDLPNKYKDYLRQLEFKDYRVCSDDKRYCNIKENNKIRGYIISRKFIYARTLLKNLLYIEKEITPSNYTIDLLLNKTIEIQKEKNNNIYSLVKKRNYEELLKYLDELNNIHGLSVFESKIYSLIENILNFDQGVVNIDIDASGTFEAIDAKNYYLARNYAKENLGKNKDNVVNQIFYLILNDLCNLIYEKEKKNNLDILIDIIDPLLNNNMDICLKNLDLWIKKNNYENYRYILFNLLYLGPYKNELTYNEFINTLLSINSNAYTYNLDSYLKGFYLALSNNSFEEAKVYLNIVKEGDKFGKSCLYVKELENIIGYNLGIVDDIKKESETLKSYDEILDLVKYRHNLIKNRGIIILEPMSKKDRDMVHHIVEEYKDMVSFSIGEEPNRQVVLRYINIHEIDEKSYLSKATDAYYQQDYNTSMSYLRELLMQENPKCAVYAKMGLNFLKCSGKKTAIDYFKIATDISKRTGLDYDFTDLLIQLTDKYGYNKEEQKAYVKMAENEFFIDDYFCGIDCIYDIAYKVRAGVEFDEVCSQYNLTEEEKALVILIFAREYFIQGFDYFGYLYLKRVEEMDNKTDRVIKLYNEINHNKTLYKNQSVDNEKTLNLLKKVGE